MKALRDNGLSLFFGAIFALSLAGQAISGLGMYNADQTAHGHPPVTMLDYLVSPDFAVDVAENWQSEFLQFTLMILAGIWLVQRGSPESSEPDDVGAESDEKQLLGEHVRADSPAWAKAGGWRTALYSNSLLIVMALIFVLSWLAQSVNGVHVYNEEQLEHGQPVVDWVGYLATPEFWNRTLQNWQSEFLAVGCMVAFSIFLRQRGSAQSKPVGAPHRQTAVDG